jgi:hypothetical protein
MNNDPAFHQALESNLFEQKIPHFQELLNPIRIFELFKYHPERKLIGKIPATTLKRFRKFENPSGL